MPDWIQVKLYEKGMAPYQLAQKMGIASALEGAQRAPSGSILVAEAGTINLLERFH